MDFLKIENLHKNFDGTPVLKGINLEIGPSEFIVLVGPSGCGKSTLLNIIAGLETLSEGSLCLQGKRINEVLPKDRNMAMVFQSYALYPNMTVQENLSFGLKLKKVPRVEREEKVAQVAKLLQIEPLLKRKPLQLSGGQRQRVAIGRALTRNPQIFLFDEPLSNLDAKLRIEMRAEIKKLHQRLNCCIIYVTHDQIEAMTLADRIAVMKDGEIQQIGKPETIYHFPANKFVAEFMGSPSMNFIPVKFQVSPSGAGGLLFKNQNREMPIIGNWTQALPAHYHGRELLLGIRPENILIRHVEGNGAVFPLDSSIQLQEPTGADNFVHFNWENCQFLSRVSPEHTFRTGEQCTFYGQLSHASFFDPTTGNRVQ